MKRKLFGSSEQDDKTDPTSTSASSDKKRRRKNAADTPKHYPKSERQQLALVLQMTSLENSPEPASPPPSAIKRTPGGSGKKDKIHKRNERGETLMHLNTIRGDLDAMKELIRQGADVNVKDFAGWTPLHEACNHGHREITRYLLQNGANVNSRGLEDDTPLHDAVTNSHRDLVELLLEYGANPLLKNRHGERPLDIADDEAIKDTMLRVLQNQQNTFSDRECSSPSQSDASDVPQKNSYKITASPNRTDYPEKTSFSKHRTYPCNSSGNGSCHETLTKKHNSVKTVAYVNGYRASTLPNSIQKRKMKKTKLASDTRTCLIKTTPNRRTFSDSSSVDSSLSSSSDSSSDSHDNGDGDERVCNRNGLNKTKVKGVNKGRSVSNDCIKRKSLFPNDTSQVTKGRLSTHHRSSQYWRKKPTQNTAERARSSSHEKDKPTLLRHSDNCAPSLNNSNKKQNDANTLNINGFKSLANITQDEQKNVDDSIYDFSPSVEDMTATNAISLKRDYKDKSSELFDILCLGKADETITVDPKISQNKNFDTDRLESLSTTLKDQTLPITDDGVASTTLFEKVKEAGDAVKIDSSPLMTKSNGLQNEDNHMNTNSEKILTDEKKNSLIEKVHVAKISSVTVAELTKDDAKSEKKCKKQNSLMSPKKYMNVPMTSTPHEKKSDSSMDGKIQKKKKPYVHLSYKTPSDKQLMTLHHSHKKKKKRNRKHSREALSSENKLRPNTTTDETSDKVGDVDNVISSHDTKPAAKRVESTKSLQRKYSLDGRPDDAKKKIRSTDSISSESGLKNSKQAVSGHKSLKHTTSNHSHDKVNLVKKDKPEPKKISLISDANCSFLSELEKSSRQRLEQEKRMKLQRKRKLQQLKEAKQNALLNKRIPHEKLLRESNDSSDPPPDRTGNSTNQTTSFDSSSAQGLHYNVLSPAHEMSNSMSSVDAMAIVKHRPPLRSLSQMDTRGTSSTDVSSGWGQSPDKSSYAAFPEKKSIPVHRSLSFSGQPADALDMDKHSRDELSSILPSSNGGIHQRHSISESSQLLSSFIASPSIPHILPVNGPLLPPADYFKAQNCVPTVQPAHNLPSVPNPISASLGTEPFLSNVPISSPMIATRVPDHSPTATKPTGTTSCVTAALPNQSKVESLIEPYSDESCAKTKQPECVEAQSTPEAKEAEVISENVKVEQKTEDESQELRILAEKEEMERKEALENYLKSRLSDLGSSIDEHLPKKLPVFLPIEKLNAVGDKDPLHDRMNIYEECMFIQRQILERRKKYYTAVVIPQPPNCYLEYMTIRGTYLLSGRKESWLSVPLLAPPPSLGEEMRALFIEHEKERVKLRLQHATQREKLIVACEQEIMRVHSRAARMLQNQQVPLSACSIFLDSEVYHLERRSKRANDETPTRTSIRDRFNGRMMLSWLQDVDDKYIKIKKVLLNRQRQESQALHAVQRTEWFLKLQEVENQGQQKRWSESKPEDVSELYVPLVNISDDFPLLPG